MRDFHVKLLSPELSFDGKLPHFQLPISYSTWMCLLQQFNLLSISKGNFSISLKPFPSPEFSISANDIPCHLVQET